MASRRQPKPEARQRCPECGGVVDPRKARPFGFAKKIKHRILEGIYCSSDCLLDAFERGHPAARAAVIRRDGSL